MSPINKKLSRREMLKYIGMSAIGVTLAACSPAAATETTGTDTATTAASEATVAPTTAEATAAATAAADAAIPTPTTAPAAADAVKNLTMLSHSSTQTESYRRMGEVFTKNTGVTLDIIECPYNDLQPKMMTELLAGTGTYDVLPITNSMLYPAGDYLEDITDLFTDELKADISPAAIESATDLKGVLKAMPLISSMPGNFYRTDIYEEKGVKPPTTWDEFLEVAKATTIEAQGDTPKIWGTLIEASAKATQPAVKLVGWFYQNGGAIQDADKKPCFNLDQNVEALQFVVDLIQKHKVAPVESSEMTYEDVHNMFMQGRGAGAINWQYMVSLANTSDQSTVKGKFAAAPVPAGKAKGVNIDFWVIAIPKDSKKKDVARQYVDLLISKEGQQDMLKSEGLVSRVSAMDPNDPAVKEINPFIDAWNEQMKWATAQPKWEKLADAFLRLSVAMNNAVTGTMTPKEALDQCQQEVAQMIA
jgi:ABC-type glycerol-3-phosphate transport system substrate-binding protein